MLRRHRAVSPRGGLACALRRFRVFCPNCGTQNTESAQTCSKCGFQLKGAAAPKFKGTMLMMNQSGGAPKLGGPTPAAGAPAPAPPAAPNSAGGGVPASGPAFKAEAPPIGGAPTAGAHGVPSRLKGTIVGV